VKDLFRPTAFKRIVFFLAMDISLSMITLYLAYLLRFNFLIPPQFFNTFFSVFIAIVSAKIFFLYIFKNYHIVWRFFGFLDAKNMIKAHILSYLLFIFFYFLFPLTFSPLPRSVIFIDFFLSIIFLGLIRASKRGFNEGKERKSIKPTLILGVNSKTNTMIQSALKGEINYYPVAIVSLDEDENTTDSYISNIKVFHYNALEKVIKKEHVHAVIITEKITQDRLKKIAIQLNKAGIKEIKQVKLLGSEHERLEDLSIEDLLARYPKDLDLNTIESFIKNKKILITGAGGSIGSEISLQCSKFGAQSLILIDHGEYNLYQIGEKIPSAILKLLNITNRPLLEEIFEEYEPDIVIHAAAYKHVPVCEENQETAVFNNVFGSKVVMDVSIAFAVQKVVIISTDKAVRPTNVMGATKRITELYAQNIQSYNTEIVAVRFGNVLGSSGSVIPKFKKQIELGGPVTVTHPEITRYFMLIPEACQLVLQTAAIAKGGELFILDMGEPIKIADLAIQMIHMYGKENEVEIVFTGLREGEKLYEELLLDESERKTQYSSIFIANSTYYEIEKLKNDIKMLLREEDKVKALQRIVPEFTRKSKL
jgi:UDP-N-acetyl-D-glucosamine 4,6-dehydratase